MTTAPSTWTDAAPTRGRVSGALMDARDWLDQRGRLAWFAAMIAAFVFAWPLGLAILGYMIWSKRMFSGRCATSTRHRVMATTGNTAFDAYRADTLKRLEDEHQAFVDFLQKLRDARDKAEFDQFMNERGKPAQE